MHAKEGLKGFVIKQTSGLNFSCSSSPSPKVNSQHNKILKRIHILQNMEVEY